MASRRMITSDIWKDDWFGELDFFEQALWIGLFSTCADDQGRMLDNPILIRASVFPYKDVPLQQISDAVARFARDGRITRYERGGKNLIQIMNWWDHQKPQWANTSQWQPPDGWIDRIRTRQNGKYLEQNWKPEEQEETAAPQLEQHSDVQVVSQPEQRTDVQVVGQSPVPVPIPVTTTNAADAARPPGRTFQDWHNEIQAAKNRQGVLVTMFKALYPTHDPPDFGRIGTTAKRVGGAGRLAELLWQHSTKPPTGNVLDYIEASVKNGKNGGNGLGQDQQISDGGFTSPETRARLERLRREREAEFTSGPG